MNTSVHKRFELSQKQRSILATRLQGRTFKEIGARFGISGGWASMLYQRAKRKEAAYPQPLYLFAKIEQCPLSLRAAQIAKQSGCRVAHDVIHTSDAAFLMAQGRIGIKYERELKDFRAVVERLI